MLATLRKRLGHQQKVYWLRIPREEETEHTLLLGDPGTGKSQIIHNFLMQIAAREPAEAVVVYDPACEFVERHYNRERGDVILNPLDVRFPYWSPSFEIKYATDRKLIAESFFPGRAGETATPTDFFVKASRSIFARMLEFGPTPAQIVTWLQDARYIDKLVEGTEHAHLIDKKAANQRGGVLGSLSDVGETLKLLPDRDECVHEISLTGWAERRRGWIFITSTQDTRSQLRPLHAAFLDILMKRLMTVRPEWGRAHPCWVAVDEAHSLKRLPSLYAAETEGRKYGLKLILGTQNKHQFDEHYGKSALTMLSAPHLKIFLRCNEPESAKWISEMIGEDEREKLKIGTTASVEAKGRDSINYSTITECRAVVSKEEIMSLPNLHGYWKYEDKVVPFRYKARAYGLVAHGFKPRQAIIAAPLEEAEMTPPEQADAAYQHLEECPEESDRFDQSSPANDELPPADKPQSVPPKNAVEAPRDLPPVTEQKDGAPPDRQTNAPGTGVQLDF